MRPDLWRSVRRLLLLCCDERDVVLSLRPTIQALRQALPSANIILLNPYSVSELEFQSTRIEVFSLNDWGIDTDAYSLNDIDAQEFIDAIHHYSFDAVMIFTAPGRSPYFLSYLCYLAGIPIRVGQSQEFGGGVLSSCIQPPEHSVSYENYHLNLCQFLLEKRTEKPNLLPQL